MDFLQMTGMKLNNRVRCNSDVFVVIDGEEQSGKSTLMIQLALLSDPTFTLQNIIWRRGPLIFKIQTNPFYTAIGHDEIGMDAYKRRGMSESNVTLNQASMVWGNKHKIVFAVLPCFWDLDIGLRRRTYLWVHVFTKEKWDGKLEKGFAEFHFSKKSKWYPEPKWNEAPIIHRFDPLPQYVFDEYERRKNQAIAEALSEQDDEIDNENMKRIRNKIIKDAIERKVPQKHIALTLNMDQSSISRIGKSGS